MSIKIIIPSNSAGFIPLDQHLCFSLYSASLAMTKVYKPLLKELGLTYPQYLVMLALWEKGSLRVSDIGAKLYLDSGTLTPLLKKLEVMGFVTRIRSSVDERQVMVELTQQGKELQAKSSRVPACVLQASGCELPEAWQMNHQLKALRANLVAAHI